jgi:signal transduction histidine kinase
MDGLLKLSRLNRSDLEPADVDLSELARRVAGDLAREESGRQVDLSIEQGLRVRADPSLMLVLLENLLGNAWKFTARNAQPRIRVGAEPGATGGRTLFIRDNGVGFDMAFAGKLFQAFQRLHPEQEFPGTGIGLAIVQRIIQRHGGKVWAEGHPGAGACFFFTLPELRSDLE